MNKLIVIGDMGSRKAYLNISEEDAIKRFLAENDHCDISDIEFIYNEFEFDDEFEVYDAWA